ncbi:MAG: phosphate starvation-inducible protein PsiF [Alphaproteobacteria bacterium]|nr:phosphate starvation-inducible protein PsiF [Alphaproteobacteria bacterium]
MKRFLALALLALSFVAAPALAEAPVASATPAKVNPQTEKMKVCAQEYHQKGILKSEHRKFMSVCLKKDYVMGSYVPGATVSKPAVAAAPAVVSTETAAPAAPVSQRDKMKQCNKDAKEKTLKGQERKDFMKSCLSAH